MTLSALGVLAVYEGSDSPGPFSLIDAVNGSPIIFAQDSDLVVWVYSPDDEVHPSQLTLNTEYTLSGAGTDGPGSVTLVANLTSDYTLAVLRREPITQSLDLEFGGDLSLDNLEARLDKLTRLLQEMREEDARSFVFLPTLTDLPDSDSRLVPDPVASGMWRWDDDLRLEFVAVAIMRGGTPTPTADIGSSGDFYVDTDDAILYGPKNGSSWGSGTSIVGPQGDLGPTGDTGPSGQTILSGTGAPANGLGSDGDFYIDTAAYDIYGPKAGGVWPGGVSLIGPSGAGTGDVNGPSGSTDNALVRFDSTTGKLLQNSSVTVSDTGTISGVLFASVGLKLGDTDSSHYLNIQPGSDLTADRIFTITTGDTNRALTLTADSTISGIAYVSGGANVAIADGGTGADDAPTAFTNLKQAATTTVTGVLTQATDAQVRSAATGTIAITPANIETASAYVALSDAATVALDWDTGVNFSVTIAGNRTLALPTNVQTGTWRAVRVVGDGTTTRTLAFQSGYLGVTAALSVSSAAGYLVPIFGHQTSTPLITTPIGPF